MLRRAIAAGLACAALVTGACTKSKVAEPSPTLADSDSAAPPVQAPVRASVDVVLADRPLFGVYLKDHSREGVDGLATATGCRPTLVEHFASVADGLSAATISAIPGTPVVSIEPWHPGGGEEQRDFTLEATIDGRWDEQYRRMALAVREYGEAVLIRFAHEMNGHWYPWGMTNGNRPGEYVTAWRHVVDLFRAEGVTNGLWVWSPNILRGASSRTIAQFWPGEEYVDVVGLTGYGVRESSPKETYDTTMTQVRRLTDRPVLLTEVGVQPDPTKRQWIAGFGRWLRDNPQVAGFIWNQAARDGDWQFNDTKGNAAAFRKALADAKVHC